MSRFRFARLVGLALAATPLSLLACEGRLHIEVQQTGVYSLDRDAIVAQQPGLSDCPADQLVLTGQGKEVPIRIVGDTKGRFGPGARIEWVGHQLHGPESWFDAFSVDNVYLLGASPRTHARISEAAAGTGPHAPLERRLHLEQENLMIRLDPEQQKPGEESDVWQWAKLTQIDPKPFSTPIDLPDLAARGGNVVLTLNFRGLSDLMPPPTFKEKRPDDHTVAVELNGKAVATFAWNGRSEVRREITLPASALKARGNVLTMSVPKRKLPWGKGVEAIDVVMFNWIEARYPLGGDLDAGVLPFQTTETSSSSSRPASASTNRRPPIDMAPLTLPNYGPQCGATRLVGSALVSGGTITLNSYGASSASAELRLVASTPDGGGVTYMPRYHPPSLIQREDAWTFR